MDKEEEEEKEESKGISEDRCLQTSGHVALSSHPICAVPTILKQPEPEGYGLDTQSLMEEMEQTWRPIPGHNHCLMWSLPSLSHQARRAEIVM